MAEDTKDKDIRMDGCMVFRGIAFPVLLSLAGPLYLWRQAQLDYRLECQHTPQKEAGANASPGAIHLSQSTMQGHTARGACCPLSARV